jgi:hypothetical protein
MTKAQKRNTDADFDLPYWPNRISWFEAKSHVAKIVSGLDRVAELLRRRIIDGSIEFENGPEMAYPLTIDDFRLATVDYFGRLPFHLLDEMWEIHFHLRRGDVYRIWPPADWPENASVEEAHPADPPEVSCVEDLSTGAKKERWPAPLATRPEGLGYKPWRAACAIHEMIQERETWVDLEDLLNKVNARIRPLTVSERSRDDAIAYLKKHRLYRR